MHLWRVQSAYSHLLVLAGLAAAVRFVGLNSFPQVQADEGLWTSSTRNVVLFGDWFMDGRTHMLLSPIFHALSWVMFELFNPSLAAARAISAFAGVVSVALLYLLLRRLDARPPIAVAACALFVLSPWAVITSRQAMIESLQLGFMLAAALCLMRQDKKAAILGGLAIACALLTKANSGFFLAVLATWQLTVAGGDRSTRSRVLIQLALCFVTAAIVAAGVYGFLYSQYPAEFARAFSFEIVGNHFQGASDPLIRIGRFGIDPELSARTLLELFRESPFLLVSAAFGMITAHVFRSPGRWLFFSWVIVGGAFQLVQTFQPTRYFFLLFPALVYFAAVFFVEIGTHMQSSRSRKLGKVFLTAALMFEAAYLAASAMANRDRLRPDIVNWARMHLPRSAAIMASSYVYIDLPNPAYAHYKLADSPTELEQVIHNRGIQYIIADRAEWPDEFIAYLDKRGRLVVDFGHTRVYDVLDSSASADRSRVRRPGL